MVIMLRSTEGLKELKSGVTKCNGCEYLINVNYMIFDYSKKESQCNCYVEISVK